MEGKSKLYITGIAAVVAIIAIVLLVINTVGIAPVDTHDVLNSDEIGYAVQSVRAANTNANTHNTQTPTKVCTGDINRSCNINNGVGIQYRTCSKNHWSSWSDCKIVTCNSGYVTSGNARSGYKCVKYTCPKYPTPSADWCQGGTIIQGAINSRTGCQGRPRCLINKTVSTCTDSDDGQNYITFGTVNGTVDGNPYSYSDYCNNDAKTLNEFYCLRNGFSAIISKNCPNGCSNGACIQNTNTTPVCIDSDGGFNIYVKGNVPGVSTDTCAYISNVSSVESIGSCNGVHPDCFLIEGSCTQPPSNSVVGTFPMQDSTKGYISYVNCPNGCADGACIQNTTIGPVCNDSDNGKNYYIKGSVTASGVQIQYDKCWNIDGQTLLELYCNGSNVAVDPFVNCTYGCSDGACLSSAPVCYDSDPQDDVNVKGYATIDDGKTKIYDQCGYEQGYASNTMLIQSYCDGYSLKVNVMYNCPNGCSNGACIQNTSTSIPDSLKMYPEFLFDSSNNFIGQIVVGQLASSDDTIYALAIASYLNQYSTSPNGSISPVATNMAALDNEASLTKPSITINTPCVNTFSAYALGNAAICYSGYEPNIGRLDLIVKNGQKIIVVGGYTSKEVKIAATVLSQWSTYEQYVVPGKSLCVIQDNVSNAISVYACDPLINITSPNILTCTDSDGLNFSNKGYVMFKSVKYPDYCISDNGLAEEYCNGTQMQVLFTTCPSGQTCSDGVCRLPSPNNCSATYNSCITNVQLAGCRQGAVGDCAVAFQNCQNTFNACQNLTTNNTCTDTDGGNNIYIYGTVTNGSYGGYDCCAGETGGCTDNNTGNYIFEQSCLNGGVVSTKYACPNGCSNGACIRTPCPLYTAPSQDWCMNGIVTPGYVDASGCQGPPICTINTSIPACTDSDMGYDTYTKGTVQGIQSTSGTSGTVTTSTDSCDSTNTTVTEYYCGIDGLVYSESATCSYGCSDGKCIPTPTVNFSCADTELISDIYTSGAIYNKDNTPLEYGYFSDDGTAVSARVLSDTIANITIYGETKTVQVGETAHFAIADIILSKITFFGLGNISNKAFYEIMSIKDFCESNTSLKEFYCTSDGSANDNYVTCPNGCSNGACIQSSGSTLPMNYTFSDNKVLYNNKTVGVYGYGNDSVVMGVNDGLATFKQGNTTTINGVTITVNSLYIWNTETYGPDYVRHDYVRLNVTNQNNTESSIVEFNNVSETKTVFGKIIKYYGASYDNTMATISVDGYVMSLSINTTKTEPISGLKVYLTNLTITETGTKIINYTGYVQATLSVP